MTKSCKPIENSPLYSYNIADDLVNHPSHYCKPGQLECIDRMEAIFGEIAVKYFCALNAYKYVERCRDKGSFKQDIEKAIWYLRKIASYTRETKDTSNFTVTDEMYFWNITKLLFSAQAEISKMRFEQCIRERDTDNYEHAAFAIGILNHVIDSYKNGENLED